MKELMPTEYPRRRFNILTGEWVFVSPHRPLRPWQGKVEEVSKDEKPKYVKDCYLCPGNVRVNGKNNPDYKSTFVFDNDLSALKLGIKNESVNVSSLLIFKSEKGICKFVCFLPRHDLTLAGLETDEIKNII